MVFMRANINSTIPIEQMSKLNQLVQKLGVPRSVVVEKMAGEYLAKRTNKNGTIKKDAVL